jgi:hypothetical protein
MKANLVTSANRLQLRNHPVGTVDVAPQQILQKVVTVEAAPSLSDLGNPRPDRLRWGVDRNRPRDREARRINQFITGQIGLKFPPGCAKPVAMPTNKSREKQKRYRDAYLFYSTPHLPT